MRTCKKCKHTKYWFQFFTSWGGLYTATYDICNRCANKLRYHAVQKYDEANQ